MAQNQTLLIEIGTEELPPDHLATLAQAFADKIGAAFKDAGITPKAEYFVTPRRIAARFFEIPFQQAGRKIEKRGPALANGYDANGNPTPAALGFARSCGVGIEALLRLETPQGSWLAYESQEAGKSLLEFLPSVIENALNTLPATKRMRWGDGSIEFLRPIHWITAVHGADALPFDVFGLKASNLSYGHRVHHPQAIQIHADNYLIQLQDAYVIAHQTEREDIIRKGIHTLAQKNSGVPVLDDDLVNQVTGLVEWPVPLYAHFDRSFLDVPSEALISSMQNHQKCFPITSPQGKLLPTFILISNTQAKSPDNIIHGNERVMQARLSDAKFFFDQDRKKPLSTRLEGLKNMTFQKKLGSLYDKSQRISKLAGLIAKKMGASSEYAERAGKLCKADLLTEMVFEFPELQGIMGNYYALQDGEPIDIAIAIQESYLPRFAKDKLPQSPVGICLALADRLDSVIGIFGIGQAPTGDKDPFGLRRQSLGILRILIENGLSLDLDELCHLARHGYGNLIDEEVIPQVVTFMLERFKAWYQEQGISLQTLEAILINRPTQPFDASRRLLAVNHFQALPEAEHLAAANKRVRNILQKNHLMSHLQPLPLIEPSLFKEPAEVVLFDAIQKLKRQTDPLMLEGKYQEALILLAHLQAPVDTFFDSVMVMTEDEAQRQNRIHLLMHLWALFIQIADISKLAL